MADPLTNAAMSVLEEVMEELERVRHLADRVSFSVMRGHIRRVGMLSDSPEAAAYVRLHESGRYGSGEAACMAYLSHHDGVLASNNLTVVAAVDPTQRKMIEVATSEAASIRLPSNSRTLSPL